MFDVYLLSKIEKPTQQGRFRYWLLGDIIRNEWSDHFMSPDLSRPFFEALNVSRRCVNTNVVYFGNHVYTSTYG